MKSSTKLEVRMYRNAARGGPIQGQRQHAQKFGEVRPCGFQVTWAQKWTNRQTKRKTYSSQYFAPLPEAK